MSLFKLLNFIFGAIFATGFSLLLLADIGVNLAEHALDQFSESMFVMLFIAVLFSLMWLVWAASIALKRRIIIELNDETK